MKRDSRTSEEIANEIANDVISGCSETIIHGKAVKMVFYDNVWNRVKAAVGTGTRLAHRRHYVAGLVDAKLRAAGVRQHS